MNYLNLNEEQISSVTLELNILLADYNLYYQKLRGYHWNILGKSFFDLHEKFEEMYDDAKLKVDEIAERVLTLGQHPVSQFSAYLEMSNLKEKSPLVSDKEMVEDLITDHGKILNQMRTVIEKADAAGDEGTIDLIGAYIRELEKFSWMLNAWYKNTNDTLKTSSMEQAKSY
ncbi:DNA starvation/stationary phase protection protein [Aquimarina sp. ERC-38]|uniref:Dps family protein n=1 Tax=Aquimarina sp. ERC-38 TaxID=2949996 RepID=UPI0022455257|nr:DNA starvation/stationary phase protection protein [Aquimarina sp. ERC-38]UZO81112.1 DNA starvation/stationary phase protection protein [Aquimarina sp. ERC-38]